MDIASTKESNPSVSIIVPVYNTHDYLEKCLRSLQLQSLNNVEFIIIDDGSTDGSSIICDRFAEMDSRFLVIHKRNEGLSAARNDGIRLSKSDYFMFVDSDDWVEKDFCRIPFSLALKYDLDLVVFRYFRHRKHIKKRVPLFSVEGFTDCDLVLTEMYYLIDDFVWNKLYKKRLFDNIQYPVGYLYEDLAVTHRIVHKAKKIYLLNEYLYHYNDSRPGSITYKKTNKMVEDAMHFTKFKYDNYVSWGLSCEKEIVKISLWYLSVIGMDGKLSRKCDNIICSTDIDANSLQPWIYRFMFWIYRHSTRLFDWISILFGARIKQK